MSGGRWNTDGSFIDRRGRTVPAMSVYGYQSEDGHWRTYAESLRELAGAYRKSGHEAAAVATECDRQDILDILNGK